MLKFKAYIYSSGYCHGFYRVSLLIGASAPNPELIRTRKFRVTNLNFREIKRFPIPCQMFSIEMLKFAFLPVGRETIKYL